MKLRDATVEDVPKIWALIELSFEGPQSDYVATSQRGFENYLYDVVKTPSLVNNVMLVADICEDFAGFVDLNLNVSGGAFLTRIGVAEKFRGQGIAERILRKVNKHYSVSGQWELDVMENNKPAIHLYRKLGLKIVTTKKWSGRLLSGDLSPKAARESLTAALDHRYRRYGFTKVSVGETEVGIVGRTVRCSSVTQLLDDRELNEIQSKFPGLDRAFVIANENDQNMDKHSEIFEIVRSHRMVGRIL